MKLYCTILVACTLLLHQTAIAQPPSAGPATSKTTPSISTFTKDFKTELKHNNEMLLIAPTSCPNNANTLVVLNLR